MHPEYAHIGLTKDKLIEEIGEVLQAIGKCERFGMDSYHPDDPNKVTNIQQLLLELDDLQVRLDESKRELDDINDILIGQTERVIFRYVEDSDSKTKTISELKKYLTVVFNNMGYLDEQVSDEFVYRNITPNLGCTCKSLDSIKQNDVVYIYNQPDQIEKNYENKNTKRSN